MFREQIEPMAEAMYYIPGNHDPIEMFDADENKRPVLSSADPGRNVHGR